MSLVKPSCGPRLGLGFLGPEPSTSLLESKKCAYNLGQPGAFLDGRTYLYCYVCNGAWCDYPHVEQMCYIGMGASFSTAVLGLTICIFIVNRAG